MDRQQIEDLLAVLDAAAGRQPRAEHGLGSGVVRVGAEEEVAVALETQPAARRMARARRRSASSRRGPGGSTVQPVKARATSITSSWV